MDGKWEDLVFLLDIAENDPHPGVRHRLVRLMVENPPFERAHRHRLDKPDLVHRIWNLIKCVLKCFYFLFLWLTVCVHIMYTILNYFSGMLSHDPKLRCDLVDLYYTLYGPRTPLCLPNPELDMLTKPKRVGSPSSLEKDVRNLQNKYKCENT